MPDSLKSSLGDWFLGILATALLFAFWQSIVLESRVSRIEADIVDPDRIVRLETKVRDVQTDLDQYRGIMLGEIQLLREGMMQAVIPLVAEMTKRLTNEIPISGDPGNDPSE